MPLKCISTKSCQQPRVSYLNDNEWKVTRWRRESGHREMRSVLSFPCLSGADRCRYVSERFRFLKGEGVYSDYSDQSFVVNKKEWNPVRPVWGQKRYGVMSLSCDLSCFTLMARFLSDDSSLPLAKHGVKTCHKPSMCCVWITKPETKASGSRRSGLEMNEVEMLELASCHLAPNAAQIYACSDYSIVQCKHKYNHDTQF